MRNNHWKSSSKITFSHSILLRKSKIKILSIKRWEAKCLNIDTNMKTKSNLVTLGSQLKAKIIKAQLSPTYQECKNIVLQTWYVNWDWEDFFAGEPIHLIMFTRIWVLVSACTWNSWNIWFTFYYCWLSLLPFQCRSFTQLLSLISISLDSTIKRHSFRLEWEACRFKGSNAFTKT